MIHVYELNGYKIAVDGNNGSIHLLDEISYDILSGIQELPPEDYVLEQLKGSYPEGEILEAYNEIVGLIKKDLLFDNGDRLHNAALSGLKAEGLKALCLHVSHDCNLSCGYCFASKGDYLSGRRLMPADVAEKAVDYLIRNSGSRSNIEIDFFGGEPLLNFEVITKTVEYAKALENSTGKKFYFTITTNGMLLDDDKIDFINRHMDNIVISIDGRKEVHDAIRCDRAGNGSYDRIVPAAVELVKGREEKSYYIRGTFTSANTDFSKDVMYLAGLGFREISLEPVVGAGHRLFIKEEDVPAILEEYEKLAAIYLEQQKSGSKIRFYHFCLDLYEGPCIYKRLSSCGAGVEYFAVSPEGSIYPCHQFVGRPEFIMGNIYDGINEHGVRLGREFGSSNIETKDMCRKCWAKTFCSGGCHANAWFSNGDITKPNEIACALQKKRIECAIMVQAAMEADGEK